MTVAYRMFQKSLYREREGRLNKFIFDYFILLYLNICHFVGYIFDDIQLRNYSYCWQYINFCSHPSSNSVSMILGVWCKPLGFLTETIFMKHTPKIAWYDVSWSGRGGRVRGHQLHHAFRITPESGNWGNVEHNTKHFHVPSSMQFWATRLKCTKTKGKHAETRFNRLRVVLIRSTVDKKMAI